MNKDNFRQEVLEQARQLMFNSSSDAVALAFGSGESLPEAEELQGLDLTALASIHRAANGAVEIKFIDRIKLLELLLAAGEEKPESSSDGFMQALDRAAQRLGGGENTAGGKAATGSGGDEAL